MANDGWLDLRAQQHMQREVGKLERERRRQAASVQNWDAAQFTVHPTCPPSSSVFVRGGRYSFTPSSQAYARRISDSTFDFINDTDDVYYRWPYTCVNAGWYLPVYLGLCWYGDYDRYTDGYTDDPQFQIYGADSGYLGGGFVEYETTGQAEDAINATDDDFYQDMIQELSLPLCRVVLRIAGAGKNNFLPIDMVNRGRSYLWGHFREGRLVA